MIWNASDINTFSSHSIPVCLSTQKKLCQLYLLSFPIINKAKRTVQRTCHMQQRLILLLDIIFTTSEDLPLIRATFKVASLNKDFRWISCDEDLAISLTTLWTLWPCPLWNVYLVLPYIVCGKCFTIDTPPITDSCITAAEKPWPFPEDQKSIGKRKTYPRISTLNNGSKTAHLPLSQSSVSCPESGNLWVRQRWRVDMQALCYTNHFSL